MFAREADAQLASLAKELDELTAANEGMATVINLLGLDQEDAAKFAADNGLKHVAVTVTDERNAGRFKISSEAGVTVMHYAGKKVAANFAVAPGGLDGAAVAEIVAGAAKMLPKKE